MRTVRLLGQHPCMDHADSYTIKAVYGLILLAVRERGIMFNVDGCGVLKMFLRLLGGIPWANRLTRVF